MEPKRPKVLLIGENPQSSSYLAKRLQERGCEYEFAVSYQEACWLLRAQNFDLVLSPMRLRDGSFFPLIALLDGSDITLFYSHAVEDGCWWLPALRHGQNCFGSSALRPREFAAALDEAIEKVLVGHVAGNAQQSPLHESSVPFFVAPFSRRESLAAGPVRAKTSALVKDNAIALKKLAR